MKKNKTTITITTIAILILLSACTIQIPTKITNNFNPSSSCSINNDCYHFLNHYNLNETNIQITINAHNKKYTEYKSTNNTTYSNLNAALTNSQQTTGENKITATIPTCNPTQTHRIGNNIQPYNGYIITGKSNTGQYKLNEITFKNEWNTLNLNQDQYIPIPIDTNFQTTINLNIQNSTGGGLKLYCK